MKYENNSQYIGDITQFSSLKLIYFEKYCPVTDGWIQFPFKINSTPIKGLDLSRDIVAEYGEGFWNDIRRFLIRFHSHRFDKLREGIPTKLNTLFGYHQDLNILFFIPLKTKPQT